MMTHQKVELNNFCWSDDTDKMKTGGCSSNNRYSEIVINYHCIIFSSFFASRYII